MSPSRTNPLKGYEEYEATQHNSYALWRRKMAAVLSRILICHILETIKDTYIPMFIRTYIQTYAHRYVYHMRVGINAPGRGVSQSKSFNASPAKT